MGTWKTADMKNVLKSMMDNHTYFVKCKKRGNMDSFYTLISSEVGDEISRIKHLLKNLGCEYRREVQSIAKSGNVW